MNQSEDLAVASLRKKDYKILARNIRVYGPEIDILALKKIDDEKFYTFFEVKTVKQEHYNSGYPVVSQKQLSRYRTAMAVFQTRRKKFINVNIGLILFDERGQLLEFLEVI